MKKIVTDKHIHTRSKRMALHNNLFKNFTATIDNDDKKYLSKPSGYILQCINIDLLIKHSKFLDNRNYTTTLIVRDLKNDKFQLTITSRMPNIWGNMYETLYEHIDEGYIITQNEAIELVTFMLADGLFPIDTIEYQ